MSEINSRWQRDHIYVVRLTSAGALAAASLWAVSYFTSSIASWNTGASFHEGWLGFASAAAFLVAIGLSIGTGFGVAALLTDDPPLPGSNS